ncbi:bola protein [Bisporella sp. PMI_857]|nr:bola protein [Bisporella sp. PMI_857]
MERAAAASLRWCMRLRTSGSCTASKRLSQQRCLASSICPARTYTSTYAPPTSQTRVPSLPSYLPHPSRPYSTESTILGTIEKGAGGVADDIAQTHVKLTAPEHLDEKERKIWELLMKELQPTEMEVRDISGGCGSMYGIEVVSERFRGLNMLKQQRLVNQVLGEEIKGWHGVQLKTKAP